MTYARGATQTYAYTGRQLLSPITFGVPSGVASTSDLSLTYDDAGNRTLMTDGLGSASYAYDT
jgi:YD repeat-containing protein